MTENTGSSIVVATQYLREVCVEVVAMSKVLEDRFQKGLPKGVAIHTTKYWPSQKPATEFFEVYSCRFDVKEPKAKTVNIGHATYLFDIGRAEGLAAIKKTPLVIVTWAGVNEGAYDQSSLDVMASRHVPLAGRLMRWIDLETKRPYDNYEQSAWFYSVPLTSVNTEADIDRLLVKPLVALTKIWPLTQAAVGEVFNDTPEVLVEDS
jgi:hypothetical protein